MSFDYLATEAAFSPCGLWRYSLKRRLSMLSDRALLVVGLNPSTATAEQDDPTVRKCAQFGRQWGFGWYWMGNLYGYRSTNPGRLRQVPDPMGPGNAQAVQAMADAAELVVVAWGAHKLVTAKGQPDLQARALSDWLLSLPKTRCLGKNQDGSPRHPLYLPYSTPLQEVA